MQNDTLDSLRRLPDAELLARLTGLVSRERGTMAEVIADLAEFDTRDVHPRAGYGSLFVYCPDELALSEGDAYAVGGEATVDNVQLRCRRHNAYEARLYFAGIDAERAATPSGSPPRP